MSSLYALCRTADDAPLVTRKISVTNQLQEQITGLFEAQAIQFLDKVTDEVPFGSDWKLDPDEIFSTDLPPEATATLASVTGNPMALQVVNPQAFAGEGIRGLAIVGGTGAAARVFIQRFTAQQMLQRKFSLMLQGDTFNRMTEPAFTLENNLVALIEDGKLKFKSFPNVKRIFTLSHLYQEATDNQIDDFCGHDNLSVVDVAKFKTMADQTCRKLVFAISQSGVLDSDVTDIAAKAVGVGLAITLADGKIVMPTDRKALKLILRFLDDGIYKAPLTDRRYMTNSKRLMN